MNRPPRLLPLLSALLASVLLLLALPAAAQEEPLVPPLSCAEMDGVAEAEPVPLYCGPTQGFYRHAEQTLDLSQPWVLFGQHDCWAMAAQGTAEACGPIGWVEAAAVPYDADTAGLAFEDALSAMIEEDAPVTDNPLAEAPFAGWTTRLPRGEQVIVLASLGEWLYVQCEIDGIPARVFVPAACIL